MKNWACGLVRRRRRVARDAHRRPGDGQGAHPEHQRLDERARVRDRAEERPRAAHPPAGGRAVVGARRGVPVKAGDAFFHAAAGGVAFGPRGLPHAFQNVGDTPGRLLIVTTPSGIERFFVTSPSSRGAPAPPPGFEPGPSEPKSEVLPLHHGGQAPILARPAAPAAPAVTPPHPGPAETPCRAWNTGWRARSGSHGESDATRRPDRGNRGMTTENATRPAADTADRPRRSRAGCAARPTCAASSTSAPPRRASCSSPPRPSRSRSPPTRCTCASASAACSPRSPR